MGASTRVRDIIADLKKRGTKVWSAQVSTLRKRLFSNGQAASRSHTLSLDDLMAAKQFADRLGSIEAAQRALANLGRLVSD